MSKKKATAISLPLSRTAKIMTSAVGVESVNQDIVALATKATEIFLMDFAQRAYDQSSGEEIRSNSLEYDDIHKLVHSDSRYDFLEDSIPKKIKFSEALKLVEETNRRRAQAEEEARRRRLEEEQERERELQRIKDFERQLLELEQQKQKELEETENRELPNNGHAGGEILDDHDEAEEDDEVEEEEGEEEDEEDEDEEEGEDLEEEEGESEQHEQ